VAQFIAKIERSDKAFQRELSRSKVRAIRNFYETAVTQPPIPGTVLLFTRKSFASIHWRVVMASGGSGTRDNFLIIDGSTVWPRCNSSSALIQTRQRISVSPASFSMDAVRISRRKCSSSSTPLLHASTRATWLICMSVSRGLSRTAVLRLYFRDALQRRGQPTALPDQSARWRSKQEKWILQAELFNEIHRWVKQSWGKIKADGTDKRSAARYYEIVRDFLKAAAEVWAMAGGMPAT